MSKDVLPSWHRNTSTNANDLSLRLGEHFAEICQWAAERELELALEIGYSILGLDPLTIGIGNLVKELSHPESQIILTEWDAYPVVHELKKFADEFSTDAYISKKYTSISHLGGVNKNRSQFKEYSTKTFLLTLITNPLSDNIDDATYVDRRRLRIWLLIQAASRLLDFGYAADRNISSAARFLVMDAHDENWHLVDELLTKSRGQLASNTNTFIHFTTALANTAYVLKHGNQKLGRTQKRFINSISSIASGENAAFESSTNYTINRTHHRPLTSIAANPVFDSDIDDPSLNIVTSIDESEEAVFSYVSDIDPTDSSAQQILNSGSVYIQTMELSHYLPWSWDKILPSEVESLENWVKDQLSSFDTTNQTGAALVWLAMRFGRSLALVERISIKDELTDEWSFSQDFRFLKRAAPRRRSAWRPDELQRQLVVASQDDLTITAPTFISDVFKAAINKTGPTANLGQLWANASSQKLDSWFNEQARLHFPRLTSAKLASYQSQQLFDSTGDFTFTRLLTSHPNSALPGACSYATWDIKAIETGLQLPVETQTPNTDSINVIGSLLAPLESVLSAEIKRCNESLARAYKKGLIQYHNSLAQYVVMALYAATGARPLRDPFETLQHFSIKHRCVFINDKNDGSSRNGRLVPLPSQAIELLIFYQKHISALSFKLQEHRPELALQLSNLLKRRPARLPFFFLLDESLRWHSMADTKELDCTLFNFGLPANLFRHRYAQRLLKEGVEPEVIEGWMGHAERGAATYSDYSVRCWSKDAELFQGELDRAYTELPFKVPGKKELPPLLYLPADQSAYSEPELFGYKERFQSRSQRIKAAIRSAHSDIGLFLNGRTLIEINDNDVLALSNLMLLRENHLPHPQAALRFRILVKVMQKQDVGASQEPVNKGSTTNIEGGYARRQLLRKRLVEINDESWFVKSSVTNALEAYDKILEWAEVVRKTTLKASLSKSRALSIGAVLMAIEKRLGYKQLLLDVMHGVNFRLLQNKRQYFIEYSEELDPKDFSAAVQRHEISYKTASLLAHGIHNKKIVDVPAAEDIYELSELLEIYRQYNSDEPATSINELIEWLCKIINQANLVQLPGVVAAALSERAPPTSFSLRDHIRLLEGRALDLPSDFSLKSEPLSGDRLLTRAREQNTDKLSLQEQARSFSSDIARLLNEYVPAKARQYAQELKKACSFHNGIISSSMVLLGYWIADHAHTGKGQRRKRLKPFARNTLTTYWSSLAPVFRGLLYDVDLMSLDSEEVTDLCIQMLEYKHQSSRNIDYFAKRLKDFFRWAAPFGVATPEWSELDLDSSYRTVSPGLIGEEEYQACHMRIQSDASLSQDSQLILSFVLLLTYRFGLRAKEAIGLLRRDWCQDEKFEWVLVQNNQYRALKSTASRRAIPLLFELSTQENDIIERTLARYDSIAGKHVNRPILCDASGNENGQPTLTNLAPRVSEVLIQVLRSVTGNPELVLHHCRHSFYNRVAPALFGLKSPLSDRICNAHKHLVLKRNILGPTNSLSRRSAMALARLMGHRLPSTGLKNYCHLVTDWIDELTPPVHLRARKIKTITQVAELPIVSKSTTIDLVETLKYPDPSLLQLLKVLRLVSVGISYGRAGELMQLHPQHLQNLKNNIERANTRIRFSSSVDKRVKLKGEDLPGALLESITDGAWQRLLHHAEEVKSEVVCSIDDYDAQHLKERKRP